MNIFLKVFAFTQGIVWIFTLYKWYRDSKEDKFSWEKLAFIFLIMSGIGVGVSFLVTIFIYIIKIVEFFYIHLK